MAAKLKPNPEGTVGPRIGADNYSTLSREARKLGLRPNTLARQLLIFGISELVAGRITIPTEGAVRVDA